MKYASRLIALLLVATSVSTAFAQTARKARQVRNRITAAVEDNDVAVIPNSQHPRAQVLPDLGPVAPDAQLQRVTMVFKLSAQQQADLEALLQQQQDPHSANYHKWLTPAQYQQRFGISDSDLAKVKQWLQSNGLVVNEADSDHSMVVFSGNAAQLGRAFHTEIHRYQGAEKIHYANATGVSIPSALAGIVLGVRALNDFHPRPKPHVKREFTSNISFNHFLAPDDLATIYNLKPLFNSGITGAGQKIAIAGQSDIILQDIRSFRSTSGLPASDPQVILVPGSGDPGVVSGDIDESSLDIEWSGAAAPGATIIFVNSGNGAFDSMQYAIQHNLAPVVSVSYGDCEPNFSASDLTTLNSLFQQASAQGQTVVSAAGDSGAADCDYPTNPNSTVTTARRGLQVDYPPSSPNVTAVGGSTFSDGTSNADGSSIYWTALNNTNSGSAISYIPEVAWNDTSFEIANGGSLSASGGGASTKFSKPSWQTGIGVPTDGQRDLPDVTFAASADHDGFLTCSQGSCVVGYRDGTPNGLLDVAGGTSVGAPIFAGVVALLNQKQSSTQGNINPALYSLAATSSDAFHDIVLGDNKVPCTSGTPNCPSGTTSIGYSAGVGYDQVTGLGSLNVANFVNEMSGGSGPVTPDFQLSPASSTLTLIRGNSTTLVVTIGALNGFSSTVTLTCSTSSSLAGTICSIVPGSVNGSGTATLTVTASSVASARPLHEHKLPGAPLWASTGFGLLALVFAGKKKSISNKALCSIALIAMIALVGVGCGGGSSSSSTTSGTSNNTTPVTGTVIVTGTSGSTTHSIQMSVTVN